MSASASHPDRRAVRRSLRLSIYDGMTYALMVGLGETFFLADAIRLGANTLELGLVVTLPLCVGGLGPLLALRLLPHVGRRRPVVVGAALAQAATLFALAAGDGTGWATPATLIAGSCVYQVAGQAAGTAWSSWYGDLVPTRIRGRYFSLRTRGAHVATFVGLIAGGLLLHGIEPGTATAAAAAQGVRSGGGFALAYAVAGGLRLVSSGLLAASAEGRFHPPPASRRIVRLLATKRGAAIWRQLGVVACLMLTVYVSSPYFGPYMLEQLGFTYLEYTAATTAILGMKVVSLPVWGRLVDRAGARSVWLFATLLVALVPLPWLWARGLGWVLVAQGMSGLSWAGFELANFTLLLDSTWRRTRMHAFAALSIVNGSAQLLGALCGVVLAEQLGDRRGLFAVSLVGRLLVALVLVPSLPVVRDKRPVGRRDLFLRLIGVRPSGGLAHRPMLVEGEPPDATRPSRRRR